MVPVLGCATPASRELTNLEHLRTEPGAAVFKFSAIAGATRRLDSARAEQTRMDWLQQWLKWAGYGDKKFEVVSRVPQLRQRALLGDIYDVVYEVRVATDSHRLEFEGFSLMPPQGENWFKTPPLVGTRLGANVIVSFFKKPPSNTHTVFAIVKSGRVFSSRGGAAEVLHRAFGMVKGGGLSPSTMSAEEVLQKLARLPAESTRYRSLSHSVTPDTTLGPDCIRFDVANEDRDVPGYQDLVFVVEQHGFICLHPDRPNVFFIIAYSERRLQEETPLPLAAEGEAFLRSFVFTPVPRLPR